MLGVTYVSICKVTIAAYIDGRLPEMEVLILQCSITPIAVSDPVTTDSPLYYEAGISAVIYKCDRRKGHSQLTVVEASKACFLQFSSITPIAVSNLEREARTLTITVVQWPGHLVDGQAGRR